MITQKEILRWAKERKACYDGIEWYSKRPKSALLTWEAIEKGYFEWVAWRIPEALPYLTTLSEDLKERALNDQGYKARLGMANIGYRLDILKDDHDDAVRWAVACQGYALEQLKDDPEWEVRLEVAAQGYALEQLKDDPDEEVRATARKKLKEMQQ